MKPCPLSISLIIGLGLASSAARAQYPDASPSPSTSLEPSPGPSGWPSPSPSPTPSSTPSPSPEPSCLCCLETFQEEYCMGGSSTLTLPGWPGAPEVSIWDGTNHVAKAACRTSGVCNTQMRVQSERPYGTYTCHGSSVVYFKLWVFEKESGWMKESESADKCKSWGSGYDFLPQPQIPIEPSPLPTETP